MQIFLTDVHTHSKYSFDGREELKTMLKTAHEKGLLFYGVSEHFDYEVYTAKGENWIDVEAYFHDARHMQEDYAGCMNVLIGAEFGYTDDEKVQRMYADTYEKYRPDFVVNSVHCINAEDYYLGKVFFDAEGKVKEKSAVYREYLGLIRSSLDVPYH